MWVIINYSVDVAFFFDIIISFLSAFQDDDMQIIDDLRIVGKNYIFGWFFIDLVSIFPFDLLLTGDDVGSMAKITRIGKMNKLIRINKLLRVFKILKERSKIFKLAKDLLKISVGFERLFGFAMGFMLLCHIVSCLWIMTG